MNPSRGIRGPVRRGPVRDFFAPFIEEKGAHMLRRFQLLHVMLELLFATLFIGVDRIVQDRGAQGFPRRTPRTQRQCQENGRHQKDRDRQPERQKNS